MKKTITIMCVFVLMISFAGCSQTKGAPLEQLIQEDVTGEITVSCYESILYRDFLEKAAKVFEEKHPGTKVNVETFGEMPEIKTSQSNGGSVSVAVKGDDSQAKANYISKINTELMSGGGADLLAMDILPFHKYAESGLIMDLQDFIDADRSFSRKSYKENILEALKYKGGQYFLPLDYRFDYIAYDSNLLKGEAERNLEMIKDRITYEELFQIARENFDQENLSGAGTVRMIGIPADQIMLDELMRSDYRAFIDIPGGKISLNDGRFASLLELVKSYGEKGYLQKSYSAGSLDMSDIEKMRSEKFFYKSKGEYSLRSEFIRSQGLDNKNSFFSSTGMNSGDEKDDKILGLISGKDGRRAFEYVRAFGINSNSDNKPLAWAFVKYLMSDEVQSDPQMGILGLPINNAARSYNAAFAITGTVMDEGGKDEGDSIREKLTEEQTKAVSLYSDTLEELSDALNYWPVRDEKITLMMRTESGKFFEGSKTASEVGEDLQKMIELYLNE